MTKVGSAVTKFKTGEIVAVGCMVDSDGTCAHCRAGDEQFWWRANGSEVLRKINRAWEAAVGR
jgi:D-arabinose 1-dehydrogenase-like Zn-dependent alcohol dehydrogenase